MVYLKSFTLPTADEEYAYAGGGARPSPGYPYVLLSMRDLTRVDFAPITMLCGGNGSGKSTLLNMIAAKLGIPHESSHYESEVFLDYVAHLTSYSLGEDDDGIALRLPQGSRLITGDDIVSDMLSNRERNRYLVDARRDAKQKQRFENNKRDVFRTMEDYDALCAHLLARNHAPNKYASITVGDFKITGSNGETALCALQDAIAPGRLYLLDEPENSLSPAFQAALANIIGEAARYFDCQFIIATHSPFLMAMPAAKLYDLDASPVVTKPWTKFQAMKDWYALFSAHKDAFEAE